MGLILLGFLHLPIFVLVGGNWEGSVSWRKPILFGVSTGMTLCSLGWIVRHLRVGIVDRVVSVIVSASLVAEVLLITLQQWRGRASHFNQDTFLDASIDNLMLILITVAFWGIGYFTMRCFQKNCFEYDYRLAAQSGMVFLLVSCVIGFVISAYGYARVESGLEPDVVGANGVTKFPHGIVIHALQFFPALVFITRRLKIPLADRLTVIWTGITSSILFLAFAIYQTNSGYARFELGDSLSQGLLTAAFISLALPLLFIPLNKMVGRITKFKIGKRIEKDRVGKRS